MSAPKRVAHAAETIRARWEQQVSTDPQTEAAQALEDTGQLLDPEVTAELVAFRALELGTAEGRVSAKCEDSAHPVWLRDLDDLRGCPWCRVAELESDLATANGVLDDTAKARRATATQALPWAHAMPDGDLHGFLDDMVSAALGRWRSGPEVPDRTVLADIERVCREWRTPGEGYRSDPEPDEPAPIQAAGFFDGVPVSPPSERPVLSSREEPHDSPLRQGHRLSHDMPDGCRLTDEQVQELGNPFLGGGA